MKPTGLPHTLSGPSAAEDLSERERRVLQLARLFEQTQRGIPAVIERYVMPYGLSVLAWQALEKIGPLGENATLSAIGNLIMVPPSTMTGIAARLEQAGLVVRRTPADDQRASVLCLTSRGQVTVEAISTQIFADLMRLVETMDIEELDGFLHTFQRIMEIIQHLVGEPVPPA